MISKGFADYLRETNSTELVEKFSDYTLDNFSEKGIPVIIAARNEEKDLPATLIALAGSTCEVWPIVIENGSIDKTYEVAKKMGAHVLKSKLPFKMAALQTGVNELNRLYRLDEPVLFTDADSLVGPTWAETLSNAVNGNKLMCASGRAIAEYGPSKIADCLGTFAMDSQDLKRFVYKEHPVGRGDNSAINFADDQDAIATYMDINPKFFIGEDDMIFDILEKQHNAKFKKVFGRFATVSSRGDRFKKASDRVKCVLPHWQDHLKSLYIDDYAGIEPDKVYKNHTSS
ncbi:MAG: glycosyltransferase family 2 protein [Candidatus Saccharimonadales bacterium]